MRSIGSRLTLSLDPALDGEKWMPIPDCPVYEISNYGRVRSFSFLRDSSKRQNKYRILKGGTSKDGYRRFTIFSHKDGEKKMFYFKAAVLIAGIWIGPRPEGLVVAHVDGDNKNDCADNLEYKTQKANIRDKFTHGTMLVGEACNLSSITEAQARSVKLDLKAGLSPTIIAKESGISRHAVYAIKYNKSWMHLST